MAPYPALTNQSVLARCARALSSAAVISALAEAGRTSRQQEGPRTAHEMNRSYSPSSRAVTFHLILLESLQFTEIFKSSSFALPSITAAVVPYRRIYGVSP